jgi:Tol biopolymer transport system component/tRNA A-37 threonylcarbamoyl transferase component Bud32
MTPERWRQVKAIFDAAVECTPASRAELIRQSCGNDQELRREVESLLASDRETGSHLDSPLKLVAAGRSKAVGTRLGPYEILAVIGAGGMGEVYKARDARLDRAVAIKVLPESFASDADRLRRFEIEAKAAGALNHPNILVVHDIGWDRGSPYLVSELLEGESLASRLKRGKLDVRRTVDYGKQIAAGLAAAHSKGISHRDIKPDNLFVTRDGRVKILDFGLAKVTAAAPAEGAARMIETEPGTIMGTVAYMSPEQVRGLVVDHRSDIFSFGCVLFEMLTGERAFRGPTPADTLSAILHADPVDALPAGSPIPPALSRTIRHCLEKDVEERFQSARDLAFDLEAASSVSGENVPKTARKRLPIWAAALGVLVAAAGVWWAVARPKLAAPAFQRLTFRRGIIQGARFGPDRHTVIYAASWNGRPMELFSTEPGQPEARLLGAPSTGLFAVSATGEIAVAVGCRFLGSWLAEGTLAQMPLNGGAPRELLEHVIFADWAPDGKQLAVVVSNGGHQWLEFPPGHVLFRASATGWPGETRVSPKGDQIAFVDHHYFGDDGSVAVLDLRGRKRTISSQFTSLQGLAWSPQGDEVWYTGAKQGGQRQLYASTLSGRERLVLGLPGMATLRDISKDGRVLLSRDDYRTEVEFIGPGDDRPRDLSVLDATGVDALSADGSTLAVEESGDGVSGEHVMYVRKTDGSPAVRIGDQGTGRDLSPDGKWLPSVNDADAKASGFWLLPLRAGAPVRVDTMGAVTKIAWFPDSKRIAYTAAVGGIRRVYLQDIGGKPRPATPEGTWLDALSADGAWLLVGGWPGQVERYALFQVDGNAPQPVRWLTRSDLVWGFATGGKAVYLSTVKDRSRIYRLDLASGRRDLWKELHPSDPAGIRSLVRLRITPDGKSIAYGLVRTASELYVVEGLK